MSISSMAMLPPMEWPCGWSGRGRQRHTHVYSRRTSVREHTRGCCQQRVSIERGLRDCTPVHQPAHLADIMWTGVRHAGALV